MDMWEPYYSSTVVYVPDAKDKIVFDRFHIMQHMGEGVDPRSEAGTPGGVSKQAKKVRWRKPSICGCSRWRMRNARHRVPEERRESFAALLAQQLKVGRAWSIKERLRELWKYRYPGNARKFFKDWYAWAIRSRLEPVRKVARMLRDHLENTVTCVPHHHLCNTPSDERSH